MRQIFSWLFGCHHKRTSFPLTSRSRTGTYVACLDCGKEFAYDWRRMRIIRELPPRRYRVAVEVQEIPAPRLEMPPERVRSKDVQELEGMVRWH
jgi:hypothetical protein